MKSNDKFRQRSKPVDVEVGYTTTASRMSDRVSLMLYSLADASTLVIEMTRDEAKKLGAMLISSAGD